MKLTNEGTWVVAVPLTGDPVVIDAPEEVCRWEGDWKDGGAFIDPHWHKGFPSTPGVYACRVRAVQSICKNAFGYPNVDISYTCLGYEWIWQKEPA